MMKTISASIILIILSFNVSSTTTYKGYIAGRVIEANGNEYGFFGLSESFDNKLFLGLDQQKGQKFYWSKQQQLIEVSADNKYLASVLFTEASQETFNAVIDLFIAFPNNESEQITSIATKKIGEYKVIGTLNAKNEYHFINDGKHNIYLKIEIDRVFSNKEKKARLLKKHSDKIKRQRN